MSDFEYKLFRRNITNRDTVNYLPATDETVDESSTARNADGLTEEQVEELSQVYQHLQSEDEGAWPLRRVHFPATFAPEQAATGQLSEEQMKELRHIDKYVRHFSEGTAEGLRIAFPEVFENEAVFGYKPIASPGDEPDEPEGERWDIDGEWRRTNEYRIPRMKEWVESIAADDKRFPVGRPIQITTPYNRHIPRWILRKVASDEKELEMDNMRMEDVASGDGARIIRARSSYVK